MAHGPQDSVKLPAGQSTGASSNYEVLWALFELLVGQSTGASSNYEVHWALLELLVGQSTGASSDYEVHWALLELLVYYLCRLGLIAIVYELETLQVISPLPDGTH